MNILTFSTLFPNAVQPVHGVFVENRLRHLVASGEVSARVLAPVPWFPFRHRRFGRYGVLAGVPHHERRHGLVVDHPRYPLVPRVGTSLAPALLFLAMRPVVAELMRQGTDIDLIDAHYFYPDGVAAVMLGRVFSRPVVVTARGSDLTLLADQAVPRRFIRWAAARADGLVTVCQALKRRLVDLGIPEQRVVTLRNGVDLDLFRPGDRAAARERLGLAGPTLLSVGLLIERKGHDLVIGALPELPGVTLLIAGEGPERSSLEHLAARLGVAERVRFLGQVAHERLPDLYTAADCLVLASSREGWANVLLEAMACGTPVVASDVWGTAEVVASPAAGLLLAERTAREVARTVTRLLASPPERAAIRAYAEGYDWGETTRGQLELFNRIVNRHR
ncbi:MAG: glycosyltransferase family 4 protein [Alphaproteobacteria bacterium]